MKLNDFTNILNNLGAVSALPSRDDFHLIDLVTEHYPGMNENMAAQLYKDFGIAIFHDMHYRARKIFILKRQVREAKESYENATEEYAKKDAKREYEEAEKYLGRYIDSGEV